MKKETIDGVVWFIDDNSNKCSVEFFGCEEMAITALNSLVDCYGCSNCSNCYGCSDCADCSRCSGCYDCADCSYCSGCYDCSNCSNCSRCSYCSGCYDCADCSNLQKNSRITDISPKIENIHREVFEAVTSNKLNMDSWHTCETTHCRAGWVVHLAGEAGYKLEKETSTCFAAMMIYKYSSPYKVSPSEFFKTDKQAMNDIEEMAILEGWE